jgi:hypothetical protein
MLGINKIFGNLDIPNAMPVPLQVSRPDNSKYLEAYQPETPHADRHCARDLSGGAAPLGPWKPRTNDNAEKVVRGVCGGSNKSGNLSARSLFKSLIIQNSRKRPVAPPRLGTQDSVECRNCSRETSWLFGQVGSFSSVSVSQRSGSKPAAAGAFRTGKQQVLLAHGDGPDGVLDRIMPRHEWRVLSSIALMSGMMA